MGCIARDSSRGYRSLSRLNLRTSKVDKSFDASNKSGLLIDYFFSSYGRGKRIQMFLEEAKSRDFQENALINQQKEPEYFHTGHRKRQFKGLGAK